MGYYPVPDIPALAEPDMRRFCEQVRSVIASLEKLGQPIEVHQPFYSDAHFDGDPHTVKEFPVYRADVPVELLYATWTTSLSVAVHHDITIRWRPDAVADAVVLQKIASASATITPWAPWIPKRFAPTTAGQRILPGQILTVQIERITAAADPALGLLSMYLRRAEGR